MVQLVHLLSKFLHSIYTSKYILPNLANSSDKGACLRKYDGYETTPMDRYFSSPKAGTMLEMCKSALGDSNAWIDAVRFKFLVVQ